MATHHPVPSLAAFTQQWAVDASHLLRPSTRAGYVRDLTLHVLPHLGGTRVRHLTRRDVRATLRHLLRSGMAPGHVRACLTALQAVLRAAVFDGLRDDSPADAAGRGLLPRRALEGRERHPLTHDALRLLLATAAPYRTADLWHLLAWTGLRLGEALALRWTDVDYTRHRLAITGSWRNRIRGPTKSGRIRHVDLAVSAAALLRHRQATYPASRWVFQSSQRPVPWDQSHVQRQFRLIAAAAGLRATPHVLRHTWATLLLADGASLQYVSQQLGHASVAITADVYGRFAVVPRPLALEQLPGMRHAPVAAATRPRRVR